MSDADLLLHRRTEADAALKGLFTMLPPDAARNVNNKVLTFVCQIEAELRTTKAELAAFKSNNRELIASNNAAVEECDRLRKAGIDQWEEFREKDHKQVAENAALRERLDSVLKSHFSLSKDCVALREDKARLDSGTIALIADGGQRCVWYGRDLRVAIDDARKEAQP